MSETKQHSDQGLVALLMKSSGLFWANIMLFIRVVIVILLFVLALSLAVAFLTALFYHELPRNIAVVTASIIIFFFLIALLYPIALIKTIAAVDKKERVGTIGAYQQAFGLCAPYLWVMAVIGVKVILWSLLLIIPGLIFSIFYSLSYFALVVDGHRGVQALAFSKKIVKPNVWRYLGYILVLGIIVFGIFIGSEKVLTFIFGERSFGEEWIMPILGEFLLMFINILLGIYMTVFMYYVYEEFKKRVSGQQGKKPHGQ